MKFKFDDIVLFPAPVDVVTPAGVAQSFTATFVYLDDEANDEAVKLGNADLLRQVWKGWGDDLVGPDDKPLPYSEAQLELLLRHSYITNAAVLAYVRARQGLRSKN